MENRLKYSKLSDIFDQKSENWNLFSWLGERKVKIAIYYIYHIDYMYTYNAYIYVHLLISFSSKSREN